MDKLLTPKDLSESLQVGLSTVYQWVNYGFVPCVKLGSLVRFREAEIEQWLRKRQREGRVKIKIDINKYLDPILK